MSTPKIALRTETGMMSIKMGIRKKKLMFVHNIQNLEYGTLAKQVWQEEVRNGWPGLAKEMEDIC